MGAAKAFIGGEKSSVERDEPQGELLHGYPAFTDQTL